MPQYPGVPLAIAEDQKVGLTFGELREFVQNGMRQDIPDAAILTAVYGWRQNIRSITIKTNGKGELI
jgi:hypothetical protein